MHPLLTVTCKHNELIIIRKVVNSHVGVSGNDLLLRRKVGALLELEITDGTGEGEVAIDTTEIDKAAGGANSCLLTCLKVSMLRNSKIENPRRTLVLRLVVKGERLRSALNTKDSSGVTSVALAGQ